MVRPTEGQCASAKISRVLQCRTSVDHRRWNQIGRRRWLFDSGDVPSLHQPMDVRHERRPSCRSYSRPLASPCVYYPSWRFPKDEDQVPFSPHHWRRGGTLVVFGFFPVFRMGVHTSHSCRISQHDACRALLPQFLDWQSLGRRKGFWATLQGAAASEGFSVSPKRETCTPCLQT
jgi:hypothetical protein